MQTLGIIDIFWNGAKLDNEPGGTVTLGGVKNTTVIYSRKVGRAQKMVASEIMCRIPIEAGQRVTDAFSAGDEGELQVQCDTGQTFVWDDAFLIDALKFTGDGTGGKLELKWNGATPLEL